MQWCLPLYSTVFEEISFAEPSTRRDLRALYCSALSARSHPSSGRESPGRDRSLVNHFLAEIAPLFFQSKSYTLLRPPDRPARFELFAPLLLLLLQSSVGLAGCHCIDAAAEEEEEGGEGGTWTRRQLSCDMRARITRCRGELIELSVCVRGAPYVLQICPVYSYCWYHMIRYDLSIAAAQRQSYAVRRSRPEEPSHCPRLGVRSSSDRVSKRDCYEDADTILPVLPLHSVHHDTTTTTATTAAACFCQWSRRTACKLQTGKLANCTPGKLQTGKHADTRCDLVL